MTLNQRKTSKINYVREESKVWNRERFRSIIAAPLNNNALTAVTTRRKALSYLAECDLPSVYAENRGKAAQATVSSLSISPLYGHILYNLISELKPRVVLEAGSGFGVSGMYIGAALASQVDPVFISFEIGTSIGYARESIIAICPSSFIIHDSASNFAQYLSPSVELDFVFLDAMHDYASVIRSVKSLKGWLSPSAVLLIDDVGQSAGSQQAWREIARSSDVKFAALIRARLAFISWQ